jgi:hypothetical protein
MIEKAYTQLSLKLCENTRSWLYNTACDAVQGVKHIRLADVNFALDVINMISLKHLHATNVCIFGTHVKLYKERNIMYKDYSIEELRNFRPNIIMLPFSINSPHMKENDLVNILQYVEENGSICAGSMYDLEYIESLFTEGKTVITHKTYKIKRISNGSYKIIYTYNLFSGLGIENIVIMYSKQKLMDLVIKQGLHIDFINYTEVDVVKNSNVLNIKESLKTRTCFLISKAKHTA